jgi:hypothetical protein
MAGVTVDTMILQVVMIIEQADRRLDAIAVIA